MLILLQLLFWFNGDLVAVRVVTTKWELCDLVTGKES